METNVRDPLNAYYREGAQWAGAQRSTLRVSHRLAWVAASAAIGVALLEATALGLLLPVGSAMPYPLLVGGHTGRVQTLQHVEGAAPAADAALTQSLVVQYVVARESFDVDDVQNAYRRVASWSAFDARIDYVAGMQVTNPASPIAMYPRSTVVTTRVKSVSPVGDRSMLVRFETQRRDADEPVAPALAWVAVIQYRFSDAPLAVADRYLNPLGFQVLRYARSVDPVPLDQPPAVQRPDRLPAGRGRPGATVPTYAAPYPGTAPDRNRDVAPERSPEPLRQPLRRDAPPPGIEITL